MLRVLEALGVVWDVRRPSPEVVAGFLGGRNHLIDTRGLPRAERAATIAGD